MGKRRDISKQSKGKLASGLLGGAVVSGLAAASLGAPPNADATCIGIFGISINDGSGGHCSSSLFGFALGLGPGTTATAEGLFTAAIATGTDTEASSAGTGTLAYAGGTNTLAATQGILNLAVAGLGFEGPLGVGTNVVATAGVRDLDFVNIAVNIGSADDALDSGGDAISVVEASDGAFNLAGNLFGNANSVDGVPTAMVVFAGGDDETLGFGTVAANVFGNRNHVEAIGTLNNATAWGNVFRTPNGSDNIVTAGFVGSPTSLSWAFSYQGIFSQACSTALCGNDVNATGPGAIAGAVGVINRNVDQQGFGVSIATQFNDTGTTANVLAASGTQGNRVGLKSTTSKTNVAAAGGTQGNRVRLNSTSSNTNDVAASGTQGNRVRSGLNAAFNRPKATSPGASVPKSVSDGIRTSTKKVRDTVSRGTSGLARDAKASADSTSSSDD